MRLNRFAFPMDSRRLNNRIANRIPPEIYHGNIDSILHVETPVDTLVDSPDVVCSKRTGGSFVGSFHNEEVSLFK